MFRIGQGMDVHRLVKDRSLILCGVHVPYELGLLGHSDADVATHALMDALLGACALGDIGKLFPDTDDRYLGISSIALLKKVMERVAQAGYAVANCDLTIVAQRPKLSPYIGDMCLTLSCAMNIPRDCVSVKATTTEHLGYEGEGMGITAHAICLVEKR